MRQVIIFRGEDGYWVAECPSLPGCLSQGKTKEEAVGDIREAICGTLPLWKKINSPYLKNTSMLY